MRGARQSADIACPAKYDVDVHAEKERGDVAMGNAIKMAPWVRHNYRQPPQQMPAAYESLQIITQRLYNLEQNVLAICNLIQPMQRGVAQVHSAINGQANHPGITQKLSELFQVVAAGDQNLRKQLSDVEAHIGQQMQGIDRTLEVTTHQLDRLQGTNHTSRLGTGQLDRDRHPDETAQARDNWDNTAYNTIPARPSRESTRQ